MKRDIAEFRTGSFTDFAGAERKFVVCALSQTPEEYDDMFMGIGWCDLDDRTDDMVPVKRMVSIGVSICNPIDEFNEKIGQKIAENKAASDEHCLSQLYTPDNGVIGTMLVDALLKQEVEFIKKHPEKVFKGYKSAKNRYDRSKNIEKAYNDLNEDTKTAFEVLSEGDIEMDKLNNILSM